MCKTIPTPSFLMPPFPIARGEETHGNMNPNSFAFPIGERTRPRGKMPVWDFGWFALNWMQTNKNNLVGQNRICSAFLVHFGLSPVIHHQFRNPYRLKPFTARAKFLHPRFDVKFRSSIDGIKALNIQAFFFNLVDFASAKAYLVGSILPALSKNPDLGPIASSSGMSRGTLYFVFSSDAPFRYWTI